MGTISDKLMRIINTKEDIRQALISKGYDIPTSIPFKEYAKMILDLPCNADSFPDIEGIVARYSASGLTNEQMAANPVWVDKTGNGYDLQLKNFSWGGMSGVGGYVDNWNSSADWAINSYWVNSHTDHKLQFITASSVVQARSNNIYNAENVYKNILNVNGLTEAVNKGSVKALRIIATDPITSKAIKTFSFETDGVIQISFDDVLQDYYVDYFLYGSDTKDIDITIEQLPLYPGFILGDGVDDFAVTEKELNFEDTYTVYTAFIPFQDDPARNMVLCGKNHLKDFYITYSDLNRIIFYSAEKLVFESLSKGFNILCCKRTPDKMVIKNLITGKSSEILANALIDNPGLYYLWKGVVFANYAKAAIAGQTICNGYFSTDEDDEKVLDWYKKQYPWLFPDQAWTVVGKTNEDEDRATIANITGNGNDLVLSNFGFSGNSGYGLYNIQKFTNWNHVADRGDIVKNGYSVTITNSKITGSSTNYNTDILYSYNSSSTTIIFKVTGLVDGQKIFLGRKSVTDAYVIDKDGIYRSDYNIPQEDGKVIVGIGTVGFTGECNITIEQIPEYEGYLVTNGVDDRVQDSSFKLNKDWTLVGEWVLLNQKATNAGITKPFSFIVYNRTTGLSLFINTGTSGITIENVKSIKAICSDGRIYLDDWSEMLISKDQDITSSTSVLSIGFNGTAYTQIAFKNLGIYNNQILSKEDCIKAYNYLQTLKSK